MVSSETSPLQELRGHFTGRGHWIPDPGDPQETPRWRLEVCSVLIGWDAIRNHLFFSGTFSRPSFVHGHGAAATISAPAPSTLSSFLRCCFHGGVLACCVRKSLFDIWNPQSQFTCFTCFTFINSHWVQKGKEKKLFLCRWFPNLHLISCKFATFGISGVSQPDTLVSS